MDTIDERITELRARGKSLRSIGRDVKMSHVGVLKRLKRMGPIPEPEAGLPPVTVRETTIEEETDQRQTYNADNISLGNTLDDIDALLNTTAARIRQQLGLTDDDEITIQTPCGWRIVQHTDA